jgi:hypothetical protein
MPGWVLPDFVRTWRLPSRLSGQRSWVMLWSNEERRPCTEPDGSNGPRRLLSRSGAVDQTLISEAGRV